MWQEFKEFALKGNVIELAIAVVLGGAFGKIVTSLVNDVVMPAIGALMGGVSFTQLAFVIKEATATSEAVTLTYGNFIQSAVDFFLIAVALFFAVKAINSLKRTNDEPIEESAAEPTEEVTLLREIRDALNK